MVVLNNLNSLAERYQNECEGGEYDYFDENHFVNFLRENAIILSTRSASQNNYELTISNMDEQTMRALREYLATDFFTHAPREAVQNV